MQRVKNFDATGIAPNGILYAGDINLLQDSVAALTDINQTITTGTLAIGEIGLLLFRYGPGEARITGALRADGIIRGLSGIAAGTYTTAQRDAIPAGSRPYGMLIVNSTTNRYEFNSGTDATPNWRSPLNSVKDSDIDAAAGIVYSKLSLANSIVNGDIASGAAIAYSKLNLAGSIVNGDIANNTITAAKLVDSIVPSRGASSATEALRALGTAAGTAAAGAHAAQHLPNHSDPIDWAGVIHMAGSYANRPSGLLSNYEGVLYYANDTWGLFRCAAGSWTLIAQGRPLWTGGDFSAWLSSNVPYDGQEVSLSVDVTNGILWHLKYDAGSASANKWRCIGGPPLWSAVSTAEATSSGSYVDLSGIPAIILPRTGEYIYEIFAQVAHPVAAQVSYAAVKLGAAATSDLDAASVMSVDTTGFYRAAYAKGPPKAGNGGDTWKVQYRTNSGTGTWRERRLFITPVRIQ